MPQYQYESTLVLCKALKWSECTKLAADEVAAAIVRDKQEMAHWGEDKKETVLRERKAQYRTGGEVVGWGGGHSSAHTCRGEAQAGIYGRAKWR
jgi:hypothetical protein